LAGTVKLPKMFKGVDGLPTYSCQVQQDGPNQVLIQTGSGTFTLNGHKTKTPGLQIIVDTAKNGDTEQLGSSGTSPTISLGLTVKGKLSTWVSSSGSVTLKAKGDGGSFKAGLVPISNQGGSALETGSATGPVNFSGSFSSCHPFAN
jgi:hypothetical protein